MLHNTWLVRLVIDEHPSLLGLLIIYEKMKCCEYDTWGHIQNTLFPYEWAQYAKVLHCTLPEWLVFDKHSSLLGPFLSYEENEVLCI